VDRELQNYYEEVIATTNTPGWALIVEDAIKDRENLNSVLHVKDAQHLFTLQGRIRELDAFIGFKEAVRTAHTKLLADEEAAKSEEPNEAEFV
jgi:hypothetical protein